MTIPINPTQNRRANAYGWVLLGLNIVAITYIYLLGTFPFLLANELSSLYQTDHSRMTFSLSFYYYLLAACQIPIGICLDKYRCAALLGGSLLLASIGLILFSISSTLGMGAITRALMGIGSAAPFLYATKAISDWFPRKKFSFYLSILIGVISFLVFGGILSLRELLDFFYWRSTLLLVGISGCALSAVVFGTVYFIEGKKALFFPEKQEKLTSFFHLLFRSSQMWIIGLTLGVSGAFYTFLTRWTIPLLTLGHHLPWFHALVLISCAMVGYSIGFFLLSILSEWMQCKKGWIPWSLLFSSILFVLLIYFPLQKLMIAGVEFFFLGFTISAANLTYAIIKEQNSVHITATAIASINFFHILAIPLVNTITAVLVELKVKAGGHATYAIGDFASAFSRVSIYFFLSFILSFFIREPKKMP